MSARILIGPWTGERVRGMRTTGLDPSRNTAPGALSSGSSAMIIELARHRDTARAGKTSWSMAAAPCAMRDANNVASGAPRATERFEASKLARPASGGKRGMDPSLTHAVAPVGDATPRGEAVAIQSGPGQTASSHGSGPGEGLASFMAIASGAAAGHDGQGFDRDGRKWKRPTDDPAVAVGLAVYFVQRCAPRGLPIPAAVMRHLDRHAAEGDATARLVRDWIEQRTTLTNGRQAWIHGGGHVQ